MKCVRCGVVDRLHTEALTVTGCPRFEPLAPLWMRALSAVMARFL